MVTQQLVVVTIALVKFICRERIWVGWKRSDQMDSRDKRNKESHRLPFRLSVSSWRFKLTTQKYLIKQEEVAKIAIFGSRSELFNAHSSLKYAQTLKNAPFAFQDRYPTLHISEFNKRLISTITSYWGCRIVQLRVPKESTCISP